MSSSTVVVAGSSSLPSYKVDGVCFQNSVEETGQNSSVIQQLRKDLDEANSKIEVLQERVDLINKHTIKWKTFCSFFGGMFVVIVVLSVTFFYILQWLAKT